MNLRHSIYTWKVMKVSLVPLLLWVSCCCYVQASSKFIESVYDTNKGVFSPQGKLVQLEYIEVWGSLERHDTLW